MARTSKLPIYNSSDFLNKYQLKNRNELPAFNYLNTCLLTKTGIGKSTAVDAAIGSFIFHALFKRFPKVSTTTRINNRQIVQTESYYIQHITIYKSKEIQLALNYLFSLYDFHELVSQDFFNISYSEKKTSVFFKYSLEHLLKDYSEAGIYKWARDEFCFVVSFDIDKHVSIEQLYDLIYFK